MNRPIRNELVNLRRTGIYISNCINSFAPKNNAEFTFLLSCNKFGYVKKDSFFKKTVFFTKKKKLFYQH